MNVIGIVPISPTSISSVMNAGSNCVLSDVMLSINNKAFHFGSYFNGSNNGNYRVGSWGNMAGFTNDYLGNDTNWKYYVVTYDKSEEEYKFYINNQLTHTHSNHPLSIEAPNFVIGSQLGYNESWYGKIDQLGVWSRILTSQEINDLFNKY